MTKNIKWGQVKKFREKKDEFRFFCLLLQEL